MPEGGKLPFRHFFMWEKRDSDAQHAVRGWNLGYLHKIDKFTRYDFLQQAEYGSTAENGWGDWMEEESIYGGFRPALEYVTEDLGRKIQAYRQQILEKTGSDPISYYSHRIKSEESMREKCRRKGLPETAESALREITDAVGVRIICSFIDDVYTNAQAIHTLPGCRIVNEKDYIRRAKPNGYRSYHMILDLEAPFADVSGNCPGHFFAEVQIRTIAMDSWANLEHQLKYKKSIRNQALIVEELKRCADEMASTDVSMQTIRDLIREEE